MADIYREIRESLLRLVKFKLRRVNPNVSMCLVFLVLLFLPGVMGWVREILKYISLKRINSSAYKVDLCEYATHRPSSTLVNIRRVPPTILVMKYTTHIWIYMWAPASTAPVSCVTQVQVNRRRLFLATNILLPISES